MREGKSRGISLNKGAERNEKSFSFIFVIPSLRRARSVSTERERGSEVRV
jgi:hypothetical protein